ncbi:MAG TPA: Dabb family protein [Ktedonobacteraceae bacterium]|nr:Dabb family protein [Ktedonobacteraceae bacterium]
MITHVVLLQPRAGVSDDEMVALLRRVEALRESVSGIVSISTGKNKSTYHEGYTYGIIMHFIDEAHLNAHHAHPAHVAVVEELDRLCERSIDFDM